MPNLCFEARSQNAVTLFRLGILEVQQIQRRVHSLLLTQICPASTVPAASVLLPKNSWDKDGQNTMSKREVLLVSLSIS